MPRILVPWLVMKHVFYNSFFHDLAYATLETMVALWPYGPLLLASLGLDGLLGYNPQGSAAPEGRSALSRAAGVEVGPNLKEPGTTGPA